MPASAEVGGGVPGHSLAVRVGAAVVLARGAGIRLGRRVDGGAVAAGVAEGVEVPEAGLAVAAEGLEGVLAVGVGGAGGGAEGALVDLPDAAAAGLGGDGGAEVGEVGEAAAEEALQGVDALGALRRAVRLPRPTLVLL